ncbi:Uncharacterised protein [Kluyvera intermedia]|nr:Uncharacterised protein [Kluyvera intermedia]
MFRRIVLVNWVPRSAVFRQNGRMSGNEEDVVKRQGFFCDTEHGQYLTWEVNKYCRGIIQSVSDCIYIFLKKILAITFRSGYYRLNNLLI